MTNLAGNGGLDDSCFCWLFSPNPSSPGRNVIVKTIEERFESDLAEVRWRELRVHMRRDALVTVAPELDLLRVATAVAADDKSQVEGWIAAGQVAKPTASELKQWESSLDTAFLMLIVQPFILIQAV